MQVEFEAVPCKNGQQVGFGGNLQESTPDMTANSKDDFLACLKASKVIVPEQLDEALAGFDSDDPRQIAMALVRRKLLTKWQAKYLVAGHSRLHVGNYQLLERLRRNEFGDRFLAVHEQLDRLVEIQILPKSLNDQQDLRKNS